MKLAGMLTGVALAATLALAAGANGGSRMVDLDLNGTWEVRAEPLIVMGESGLREATAKKQDWQPAHVPGEIHWDLVRAGKMPEPSVDNNAPLCRWPETKSWWFRRSFEVDAAFLSLERQRLVFEGLDLYAQVFVNGKPAGESADAFVPCLFDVKGLLHEGRNELVVRLTAGNELAKDDTPPGQGQPFHQTAFGEIPNPAKPGDVFGHRNWFGRKWLRKPQASYGWDWQDSLPNIGIGRDVRLSGRTYATLEDLRLDTVREKGKVSLELEAVVENLHPWSERAGSFVLRITPPDGGPVLERRYALHLVPGRAPVRDTIPIPNPHLWWPNGMGEQPLYAIEGRIEGPDGKVYDRRTFSVGLRTVEIDRSPMVEGSRFCIKVNGQDVFCRGGNLGPFDVILARVSDAKYRTIVSEAKNANFTMFRINGVSVFERDTFYEACDRAGILVMQDFPFTCATYPDGDPAFRELVRNETEAALKLLRHHPSLAVWSGGNECIWGLCDWYNGDRSKPLDLGGTRLYNEVLPDVCRSTDPRRPYWPSSPCGGENPGSDLQGDCHWWGAYLSRDVMRRIRHEVFDECRARFVSEWGFPAPCHPDTLAEYLTPAERNPDSFAWKVHTNQMVWDTLDGGIRYHYADPEKLSRTDTTTYGQMVQAQVHGGAMEALRFRKHDRVDDCEGALIWSYTDCWGEIGWSLLDGYLRRKPSYYSVRRACAPVKVIVRKRGQRLVTRLVNDTMKPVLATVEYGWWRVDGKKREVRRRRVSIRPNAMLEVGADANVEAKDAREWVYAATLSGEDGIAYDHSLWLLAPIRQLRLPKPTLEVTRLANGTLEVVSETFAHGVHTEDHGHEVSSDNWFDLLPGVPVRLRAAGDVRFEAVLAR